MASQQMRTNRVIDPEVLDVFPDDLSVRSPALPCAGWVNVALQRCTEKLA